jgi:hypothetical protein
MEVGAPSGTAVPLPLAEVEARSGIYAGLPSLAFSPGSEHDSIIKRQINKYIYIEILNRLVYITVTEG